MKKFNELESVKNASTKFDAAITEFVQALRAAYENDDDLTADTIDEIENVIDDIENIEYDLDIELEYEELDDDRAEDDE